MRKVLLALLAVFQLVAIGCHHNVHRHGGRHGGKHGCRSCGHQLCHHGHHGMGVPGPTRVPHVPLGYMHQQNAGPPGPETSTYAYPYYTLRAPRDFLMDDPPSIGP